MRKTKKSMSLPYNPALNDRVRVLRRAGNLTEVLLWQHLKNNQLHAQRDAFLAGLGLTVIHLRDRDVRHALAEVLHVLREHRALSRSDPDEVQG